MLGGYAGLGAEFLHQRSKSLKVVGGSDDDDLAVDVDRGHGEVGDRDRGLQARPYVARRHHGAIPGGLLTPESQQLTADIHAPGQRLFEHGRSVSHPRLCILRNRIRVDGEDLSEVHQGQAVERCAVVDQQVRRTMRAQGVCARSGGPEHSAAHQHTAGAVVDDAETHAEDVAEIVARAAKALLTLSGDLIELGETEHAHRLPFGVGGGDGSPDGCERRVRPRGQERETPRIRFGAHRLGEAWSESVVADRDPRQTRLIEPGDEVPLLLRSLGNAEPDGHQQLVGPEPFVRRCLLARMRPQHRAIQAAGAAEQPRVEGRVAHHIGDREGS